jgi:DNA-directed RNA polymerase specialized sigma24 family protein
VSVRVHDSLLAAPASRSRERASGDVASTAEDRSPERIFSLVYGQMRALSAGRWAELDDLVQSAAEQAIRALPSFEGARGCPRGRSASAT